MYYVLVRTRRRQKTYYYYTLCHRRRRLRARYVYDGVLTKRNVAIDVKTGPHSCACRASTPLLSRTAIVAAAATAATAVCPTVRPSVSPCIWPAGAPDDDSEHWLLRRRHRCYILILYYEQYIIICTLCLVQRLTRPRWLRVIHHTLVCVFPFHRSRTLLFFYAYNIHVCNRLLTWRCWWRCQVFHLSRVPTVFRTLRRCCAGDNVQVYKDIIALGWNDDNLRFSCVSE